MALVGIELETLVSESDALTTRPPPCKKLSNLVFFDNYLQNLRLLLKQIWAVKFVATSIGKLNGAAFNFASLFRQALSVCSAMSCRQGNRQCNKKKEFKKAS